MAINPASVGNRTPEVLKTWGPLESMLYALGVGAGQGDPRDLPFVTENSAGAPHQVLPTFAVIAGHTGMRPDVGDFDMAKMVHAGQEIRLHQTLSAVGRLSVITEVAGIHDRGESVLVRLLSRSVDADSGELVIESESQIIIRGEGGFGGEPAPMRPWHLPDRAPDRELPVLTRPEQALIYRLSGDRNPLHSDPSFAMRAGFDKPILHGLCTYGASGRVLLHELCGSDPERFVAMSARFTAPVVPGESLTVEVWEEPSTTLFRTVNAHGRTVLDRGVLTRKEVTA